MKKIVLAATALVALAGSAFAADMSVKAPAPAAAYRAISWTGCYIGAGGGYGMWNQDNQTVFTTGGAPADARHTDGGRGYFGTGQVGCDYQFTPKWLIGAFGDVDFGRIKGSMNATGLGISGDETLRSSWAAGARLGYLPYDTLLTYVSGGFTSARFSAVDFVFVGGVPTGLSVGAQTYRGWFLGSGFEYKLDWLPGLFWKNEYRFADYGTKTNDMFITATGAPFGFSVNSHKYVQTVRSELVWRFWTR